MKKRTKELKQTKMVNDVALLTFAFLQLRRQRTEEGMAKVLPPEPRLPVSLALVAAFTLLLFGLFVVLSLMARAGPFGA
jgi:hypothetical protein